MNSVSMALEDIEKLHKINRGQHASIYQYNDDTVLKLLNSSGKEVYNSESFEKLIGNTNETCVFPKTKLLIDGEFYGYLMEHVKGSDLQEKLGSIDISTLLEAIRKVEEDLQVLSKDNMIVQDLNENSLMWDEEKNCIRIIDTDFFYQDNDISQEDCYNINLGLFNTVMEQELGVITDKKSIFSYLSNNTEYKKLYKEHMINSIKGNSISMADFLQNSIEIIEKEMGANFSTLGEIEQVLESRESLYKEDSIQNNTNNDNVIPIFTPPEDLEIKDTETQQENESKVVYFEEYKNSKQRTESIRTSQIGIKQKIANFLADKSLLRRIPFIDKFVAKEQRLLPETTQKQKEDKTIAHAKFEDEISGHGKYKDLFLGKPVKNVSLEMNRQKNSESHSMADPEKIAEMKKKMDGKSLEDDL